MYDNAHVVYGIIPVMAASSDRKTSWKIDGRVLGTRFIACLSARTMRSAEKIDWHAHRQLEILGCLKGSLTYEFADHRVATLRSGHFLVIPPDVRHRIDTGVTGPARRFSIFLSRPDAALRGASAFSLPDFRELTARLLAQRFSPRAMPLRDIFRVTRLADLIEREGTRSLQDLLLMRTTLGLLLVEFANAKSSRPDASVETIMKEAELWLEAHLTEKIVLDRLVAHIGYGRSRFFALFKAHSGLTPVEWVTRKRIDRAKSLLKDTGLTVREIAARCGFSAAVFFARVFTRYVGQSPSSWRAQTARKPLR